LSIKFPDLQVLFPRSHDGSRLEQAGQKHPEAVQAQLGSQAGAELAARRSQVAGTEQKQHARIDQRDSGGRRRPPQQHQSQTEQEKKDGNEGKLTAREGLGRKIDIRI
jgi:hypothetical protein